ncbi:hypothetical protein JTE90_011881 [Oedothorax gibbosus]|uniref:PiggyBac transposable element-derived protein 4 C-terminal zinc-ribbon domain-containing protein n=1 Tax=Oedothorax gibbosus TaxID=931172 RepID=A0AAV6V546_9ARAC|nr:hypothetical protein JTE90_011881 [Oedothorax gibbosus]
MDLHFPIKSTRRRCTLCSRNRVQKRTSIQCSECKVALCSEKQNNCFQLYHQLICVYPWLQSRFVKPDKKHNDNDKPDKQCADVYSF